MLNKNDPLIGAVQEVMKRNQAERDAARLVNEKFGVTDRKALPHEKQGAWDAAYKTVLTEGVEALDEKLVGNQHRIDANKNGRVDGHDFKLLKKGVRPVSEGEAPKTDPYAEGQASSISTVDKPKKEVTPADQSALKKKIMSIKEAKKVNPYAVGMAAVKKSTGDEPPMEKKNITKAHKIAKKIIAKKKMNEGFNNRHGLSVTASAEKQAVADQLNEKVGNPLLLNRAKARARIGDTGVRRPISGTNNVQTRLANMRKSAPALDSTRNTELDKPGLEKAGVAQALKDPKAREVLAQTTKDAANFAVPAAMTGGPVGNAIIRGGGALYNYTKSLIQAKRATQAGKAAQVASQTAKPATTAAREADNVAPTAAGQAAAAAAQNVKNKARISAVRRKVPGAEPVKPPKPATTQSGVPAVSKGVGQGNRLAGRRPGENGPWGSARPPSVGSSARPTTPNAAAGNAARIALRQRLSQTQSNKIPVDVPDSTPSTGPSFEKSGKGSAPSLPVKKAAPAAPAAPVKKAAPVAPAAPAPAAPAAPVKKAAPAAQQPAKKRTAFQDMMRRSQAKGDPAGTPGRRY